MGNIILVRRIVVFGVLSLVLISAATASSINGAGAPWPGTKSSFHSYTQYTFKVESLNCKVVIPNEVADGKPWIWRARFFGHEPQTDIACLENGFHVAYVDVSGLFGSPTAIKRWDSFYEYLTTKHGLNKKPALEGMSRGGLIIFNWASANPDKVSCIYADAPVCDFKSWPGGKGTGAGSSKAWVQCLQTYGMTEEDALNYKNNPIDNLQSLAAANIPLLHVVGDVDKVVPVAENTAVIEKRYKELGGSIEVIHKNDVGHHPHSLKDPLPIVNFILKHARPAS
jgi:pimeloyl-ACP methyl ester carboxylesterase